MQAPASWKDFLGPEILELLPQKRDLEPFQPAENQIFRAMEVLSPEEVRVVFLGMDPYPGAGVPEGLAFSVPLGEPLPASLRNIFKELEEDKEVPFPSSGSLLPWAKQGVLLWNVALSVEPGKAGSHLELWKPFSEAALQKFPEAVFVLLGRDAQETASFAKYQVRAPHPSPLSAWRGFRGSRIFSKTNTLLAKQGKDPIDWSLP